MKTSMASAIGNRKEWRCPMCNRLLGFENEKGDLEIESKNGQTVVARYSQKQAMCKCGTEVTIRKNMVNLTFTKMVV